jgi:hypothetical protein
MYGAVRASRNSREYTAQAVEPRVTFVEVDVIADPPAGGTAVVLVVAIVRVGPTPTWILSVTNGPTLPEIVPTLFVTSAPTSVKYDPCSCTSQSPPFCCACRPPVEQVNATARHNPILVFMIFSGVGGQTVRLIQVRNTDPVEMFPIRFLPS